MATGELTAAALAHPVFTPLRTWLDRCAPEQVPAIADLNHLLEHAVAPPRTASGHAIRFHAPDTPIEAHMLHYESKIHETGHIPTRPGNLHDLFNALAWLAFPKTKAAMNARHIERMAYEGRQRGSLRDLLTLFDESGVIVACADPELESMARRACWSELFWTHRPALLNAMRFIVVGHAAYEKALTPYPGITCKCLFLNVSHEQLCTPEAELRASLDMRAAAWIAGLTPSASPQDLPPLPIFGFPGWLPGSSDPAFYNDRRWFRPARHARGSLEQMA